ncbi:uncharacterized protein LOC129945410 [Eupeodes corollae]|uniref:uncharacterized protein LOC129945410 n=1 Tax=Eupeodes corollae TaxID=290404 RepID=UPI00249238D5|nr:uncharacterized protein LOC129945410 [Eupeodes corollae]XP_055911123.1 uncharacterized protein LOC129945410 [Eupeodes corollae]XP_055911124.1 uncharacterized protein LOC129945410 [Eupeodes corollae]XP_055911125.1 uncharacterized protein LOC129945410 [Eupeodes corollae]
MGEENVQQRKSSRKRRALLLRERVTVIEMYNTRPRPNYDTLARMFNCGRSQIKNILRQKGQILQEYHKNPESERVRRRVPAILLTLNRLVDEWLRRALGHKIRVSAEMILQKAVQVQQFLDYEEFEPTKAWLRSFRRRHGYYRIDLRTLEVPEDRSKSLKIMDIFEEIKNSIDFNVRRETEQKLVRENSCDLILDQDSEIDSKIIVKNQNWDDSLEEFPSSENNENETVVLKDNSDALDYLRPLEEFAMLTDNFRAIGLISQLEAIFRSKARATEDV